MLYYLPCPNIRLCFSASGVGLLVADVIINKALLGTE